MPLRRDATRGEADGAREGEPIAFVNVSILYVAAHTISRFFRPAKIFSTTFTNYEIFFLVRGDLATK